MSELRPLLDGNADELALALLRSADDDSPSADSLKAAAVALGLGTSLGGSALLASGLHGASGSGAAAGGGALSQAVVAASPGVGALTVGLVAKQVVIGLATGVVAMSGLELAGQHPFGSRERAPSAQVAHVAPARPALEARARNHSGVALPAPEAAVVSADAADPSAPAVASEGAGAQGVRYRALVPRATEAGKVAEPAQAAVTPAPEAKPEPELAKPQTVAVNKSALNKSLAADVAMLDRARSALLAKNPSGALRALEQYRKERQTGILDPEATVLWIQALEKLGERVPAARLARQFIASHPESRHVDSLRVLAAEAQ